MLQICFTQEGVGIIRAVEDGLNCVALTLAVIALGLRSVGVFFKKIKKACLTWLEIFIVVCSSCVHISLQRKSPLSALLYLSLWLSPVDGSGSKPVVTNYSCQELNRDFSDLFLKALDDTETRIGDEVDDVFDEISLGPFGTSLIVGEHIFNFRADVFEKLFGMSGERAEWINGATSDDISIPTMLSTNIADVAGIDRLNVTCVLLNDMYTVDVIVQGSINVDGDIAPQVTLLPAQYFHPLGLNVSTFDVEYELKMPFALYRNKIVHLGETQAKLSVQLDASISESLPILVNKSIDFNGVFGLNASLSYSSIQGITPVGSFVADLIADLAGQSYVGLKAEDDDLFDYNPRE